MSGSEFERENIVAEALSATAASKPADTLLENAQLENVQREHDWRPPAEGPVTADKSARPRPAHSASGSEAIELEKSATNAALVYRTLGERMAEPKLVPSG